jgi:hypothetical protein
MCRSWVYIGVKLADRPYKGRSWDRPTTTFPAGENGSLFQIKRFIRRIFFDMHLRFYCLNQGSFPYIRRIALLFLP